MTSASGFAILAVVVSYATGMMVISVVVAAIAVLVFALWRRSAGYAGSSLAGSSGPRTDSHAISTAPGHVISTVAPDTAAHSTTPHSTTPAASQPDQQRERPVPVAPPDSRQPASGARAPHPSGLGAAELAAIVEDGLASLRSDVDTLGDLVDSVGSASAVPEDLPARPAAQQVALIDQVVAMIASDLERAHRLAETVALDVDRGHRARAEVHGELDRIGLPVGFFVAMDTTAAELAVDLVRAQMAVERLTQRFASLSSLYSSVRPTVDLLAGLGAAIGRAVAVTDPWRRSPDDVDLAQRARTHQTPQPLPG